MKHCREIIAELDAALAKNLGPGGTAMVEHGTIRDAKRQLEKFAEIGDMAAEIEGVEEADIHAKFVEGYNAFKESQAADAGDGDGAGEQDTSGNGQGDPIDDPQSAK